MKMIIPKQEYDRLKEIEKNFNEQISTICVLKQSVLTLKSQITLAQVKLREVYEVACEQRS
jgi:uncharacterized coiled-coil protein SlyX